MIFLDTNVFIEIVGRAGSSTASADALRCRDLFDKVTEGLVAATTSEAILAEVTQVLTSRFGNELTPAQVRDALDPLLMASGLRLEPKRIYRRALAIWADRPNLGFVDALTIAYVEQGDIQLASFDRQLLSSPGVSPYWQD